MNKVDRWKPGGPMLREASVPASMRPRARHEKGAAQKQQRHDQYESARLNELQREAEAIVNTGAFEFTSGFIIIVNALAIGIEQAVGLGGSSDPIANFAVENVFLIIYLLELGLRFFAKGGQDALNDVWIRFDMLFVLAGVLTNWVLEPLFGVGLGPLVIFRILRLLRIVRTARLFFQFEEFRLIVRSFLISFKTCLIVFGLLFMSLYVFGVLGVELITKHDLSMGDKPDAAFQQHVEEYFASLPSTMLTLLSVACLDNLHDIWHPIIDRDGWIALYFISLTFIIGIVAMSLIQAVIFSATIEQNASEVIGQQRQHEEEFAELVEDLKTLFGKADADESGTVTLGEFLSLSRSDTQRLCNMIGAENPADVFKALDVDRRGEVSTSQFFDGLGEAVMGRGVMDDLLLKRMEMQIEATHLRVTQSMERTEEIFNHFNELFSAPAGPAATKRPAWASQLVKQLELTAEGFQRQLSETSRQTQDAPCAGSLEPPATGGKPRARSVSVGSRTSEPGTPRSASGGKVPQRPSGGRAASGGQRQTSGRGGAAQRRTDAAVAAGDASGGAPTGPRQADAAASPKDAPEADGATSSTASARRHGGSRSVVSLGESVHQPPAAAKM